MAEFPWIKWISALEPAKEYLLVLDESWYQRESCRQEFPCMRNDLPTDNVFYDRRSSKC